MGDNGGNGHIRVEGYFDLEPEMLEEAVQHYLIREKGVKNAYQIEWNIDFHEGYNVPKEAIKNISARCYLRQS
jgi:hypothetical protein